MLTSAFANPSVPAAARRPFGERSWWPVAVVVAAIWVAVVHGALWWLDHGPSPKLPWGDEVTYLDAASKLLAGVPGWRPEPLWPPLYPQFVAGLMWLGGDSLVLVVIAQSLLLVATAILLADFVCRMTGSRAAGMTAAAMVLGYPPLVGFAHFLWPEVLHLFLFVALLWLLATKWNEIGWCAVSGLVLGLAVLTKSLLLPFVPVLLAAAAWRSRPRAAALRVVVVVSATLITVAPTVTANARRLGSPVLAGSATFNLWVGLNDVGREGHVNDIAWREYRAWLTSAEDFAGRERVLWSKISDMVRRRGFGRILGEQLSRQYFRLFDASCYLTDQLPGGVAWVRSPIGYRDLGAGPARVLRRVVVATVLLLYLAAPLGLAMSACGGNRWLRVLLMFLAYNLLIFLWLHVTTRYRVQLLPVGFVGVGCLAAWVEAGGKPRLSWRSAAAAIAIAASLVGFAFG